MQRIFIFRVIFLANSRFILFKFGIIEKLNSMRPMRLNTEFKKMLGQKQNLERYS